MLNWALKSLWTQKAVLFSSAGGVAAAFMLVLFMGAVWMGESKRLVAYIRHTNPDVWVMQRGVSNMHMASSFIWDWKADKVASISGVKEVTPILSLNTAVKAGNRDWFSYVVGLEPGNQRAGPWAITSGRAVPGKGEIVLPVMLSRLTGIGLGDAVSIADKSFTVIGFSEGTFSMANSFAFVSFDDLEDILSATGIVSYLLVDAEPGQDPAELARRIESEVEKVSALPQAVFIQSDFEMVMMMGLEIIAFMTVIGSALAAIIIAFTAYAQVARRHHELAIAKALGVRNVSIYTGVIMQTLIITSVGYALALTFALGLMPGIAKLVPQVTFLISTTALVRMGIIALSVALLAALIPAYTVAKVDPMTAFKV